MRLGGTGLTRHRQRPAEGTGGRRRGPVDDVPAQRVGQRVGQSFGHHLFAGLGVHGDLVAAPVVDLVDRIRRTPHTAGGQRGRHVGEFERIDLERAEGERADVLPFDEVGQALVVLRVVGPGGARVGVGTQAEFDRHVDGALHPDLRDEFGERGVGRLGQRLGDTHGQVPRIAVILHAPGVLGAPLGAAGAEPLGVEPARHVQHGCGPQTEVHCGGGGEDLEYRACSVADQREGLRLNGFAGICVESVGAVAHHRDDRMGGLARQHNIEHVRDSGEVRCRDRVDGFLRRGLHVGIQRRLDQVAALGYLILGQAGAGQILLDVVAEEGAVSGGDASAGQFVGARQDAQRLALGRAEFGGLARQVLQHRVEHEVAPGKCAVGIGVGVQRTRRLHQTGQQRRLLPIQFGGIDPEVGLGCVLNTERAVAE